mgnify:CR=1 FL=1
MELLSMGSRGALIFHISLLFLRPLHSFFFLYALFDVTTTKEQNVSQKWRRSCTTNDDGCAVICHAKKEFVGRWPKTSIGNESGWPCTTRIPICWDLKVSVT